MLKCLDPSEYKRGGSYNPSMSELIFRWLWPSRGKQYKQDFEYSCQETVSRFQVTCQRSFILLTRSLQRPFCPKPPSDSPPIRQTLSKNTRLPPSNAFHIENVSPSLVQQTSRNHSDSPFFCNQWKIELRLSFFTPTPGIGLKISWPVMSLPKILISLCLCFISNCPRGCIWLVL